MPRWPDGRFGLAFLGCGAVTRAHSRTLAQLDPCLERFYASRDPERARGYARRLGGAGSFGSYESALADPRVDAALVATPPHTHRALTLMALEAGKHVIVEKPAFTASADFGPVERAATAAGRRVLVAENYFYKPLARQLRRVIADGLLGEVLLVSVNALKRQVPVGWRAEASPGGALLEGGIHWVSLMGSLGLTIESASGVRFGRRDGGERSMLCSFSYEGGAAGSLAYSWEVPSPLRGLRLSRIHGRAGSATFESNGGFVLVAGRRPLLLVPGPRDAGGYGGMFADLLGALRTGATPAFTFDMAHRDVLLVEEICRTAADREA